MRMACKSRMRTNFENELASLEHDSMQLIALAFGAQVMPGSVVPVGDLRSVTESCQQSNRSSQTDLNRDIRGLCAVRWGPTIHIRVSTILYLHVQYSTVSFSKHEHQLPHIIYSTSRPPASGTHCNCLVTLAPIVAVMLQ